MEPMKAKLIEKPFSSADWIFELKWDGYRAMANVKGGKVILYSRNLNEYTKYKEVSQALKKLPFDAVLDGEVVAHDANGKISFQHLQNFERYKDVPLTYYVFDILYYNGYSLLNVPLTDRKLFLEEILPPSDVIKYSEHFPEIGERVYEFAGKQGLEGIIGKRADSYYSIGKRSAEWVKVKVSQSQEGIIVGYTDPKGSREYLGTLLLAVNDGKKLRYIGTSGGGFTQRMLKEIYDMLQPIRRDEMPLPKRPISVRDKIYWVEPKYVCEVTFAEWSHDGLLRQPVFKGLRKDKSPDEVVMEKAE